MLDHVISILLDLCGGPLAARLHLEEGDARSYLPFAP